MILDFFLFWVFEISDFFIFKLVFLGYLFVER